MTRLILAVLGATLLPGLCLAQGRGATDAGGAQPERVANKYFYTVLAEGGDEWAYRLPECDVVPATASLGLKNCVAFNGRRHHQMCESSKFVESTSVLTKESRKFMLVYHVFDTRKTCMRDRKEALNGD
jgi:hypothetical protein